MRKLLYMCVLGALISSLIFAPVYSAEQRKVTQEDVEWGDPSTTVTSAGGHVGHRIDNTYKLSAPYIDVRAYGAVGDGVTDDTIAIQYAIDNAWTTGATVVFPSGKFRTTSTVTLPLGNGTLILQGAGMVKYKEYEDISNKEYGTRVIADHTGDAFTSISSIFTEPTYVFNDLTISGTDTSTPRTTNSGNGIKIYGAAVPRVFMSRVYIGNFYGGSGIWADNWENGTLQDVYIRRCKYGLRMSSAINAYTFINVSAEYTSDIGIWWDGPGGSVGGGGAAKGQSWVGGMLQGNEKTGMKINGLVNASFLSMYFETNNTTKDASSYPLYLTATDNGNNNGNISFYGTTFNESDNNVVYATGVSGYLNYNINFYDGNITPGGGGSNITVANAYNTYWKIMEMSGAAASQVTLDGIGHKVYFNGVLQYGDYSTGGYFKFTNNADNPADSSASIYNQFGVGPTVNGGFFEIRTGETPTQAAIFGDNVIIFARKINATSVATYDNNTAAVSGGLSVGDVYKTSSGVLMIRY